MAHWIKGGGEGKNSEMHELLRDYVLVLANKGIRHGTEAASLKWRNLDWITKDGVRYLRLTVNGITGSRQLIARHATANYLKRIQSPFADLQKISFDDLLKNRLDKAVFRLANGAPTKNLNQTFSKFMRDSGLAVGAASEKERTLYSLRHMYATFTLRDWIGIHELERQMGISVGMLEKHYSKITRELVAAKFAGKLIKRHGFSTYDRHE